MRRQRPDRHAALDERDRQLGRGLLGGLEAQLERVLADAVDAAPGAQDADGPGVVGRAQAPLAAGGALEVVQRALEDDEARADDGHPVAELLDLGEQVAGQQDGRAAERQPRDERPHVAHPGRVQARGRLVEQQELRVAQERRRDAEPLAHAVRVAAHLVALAVGELDDVEDLVDPPAASPPSSAASSSRFLRPVR